MIRPTVYLCGTITPDPKHLTWRETAEEVLSGYGIDVLSPCRGKNPNDWTSDGLEGSSSVPYSNGGFVARDKRDLDTCDAVLLVFMEESKPERQSLGTWMEAGYAVWGVQVPLVVVTDMHEIADHPFIYKTAAKVVSTLTEGLQYLRFLLSD